jgi:hypothetical protein
MDWGLAKPAKSQPPHGLTLVWGTTRGVAHLAGALFAASLGLFACGQDADTMARPGEAGFDSLAYCEAHPKNNGCCLEEARNVIDFEDASVETLSPLSNRYVAKGLEILSAYVVTDKFEGNQVGNAAVSGKVALLVGFNKSAVRITFNNPEIGGRATVDHVSATVGDKSPETDLIILEAFDFGGKKIAADSFQSQPSGKVGEKDFGEVSVDTAGIYAVTIRDTSSSGANLDDLTYGCLHYRLR